ncbi:MAG: hypothetical protein RIM72_19905 [Alphaproteobacteria bacterium]
MTATAAASVIDIALWFMDRARQDDLYLQPQLLQRLLYVTQGSYAAQHYGRKLMPAVFVAGETGPEDPNIMRLFEYGRPSNIRDPRISPEVENFLYAIWSRYGHHSTDYLNQQIKHHSIYRAALKKGIGEEIPFPAIVKFFTREKESNPGTVKTADGRKLSKWIPAGAPQAKLG